jgi:ATP/ADP translocase
VFSLFAVAVFWSFMADLFDSEQGKRLFGFIGAGGTAGSLLGPVITIGRDQSGAFGARSEARRQISPVTLFEGAVGVC